MSHIYFPSYYILRDRIPFLLTILYIYRNQLHPIKQKLITLYLLTLTNIITFLSIGLRITNIALDPAFGIKWSYPSPIEWGIYIIITYNLLALKGIPKFQSYYIAFMTAMGGGWLYDTNWWIRNGTYWNIIKYNTSKIFFIDFQVICLPIVLYIIYKQLKYKPNKLLIPATIFPIVFYSLYPKIGPYCYNNFGEGFYGWIIRIPIIILLFVFVSGINYPTQQPLLD